MVWQPNILNNCYELSNHPPGALGDFRSTDPLCPHLQILAAPLAKTRLRVLPTRWRRKPAGIEITLHDDVILGCGEPAAY